MFSGTVLDGITVNARKETRSKKTLERNGNEHPCRGILFDGRGWEEEVGAREIQSGWLAAFSLSLVDLTSRTSELETEMSNSLDSTFLVRPETCLYTKIITTNR